MPSKPSIAIITDIEESGMANLFIKKQLLALPPSSIKLKK